MLTEQVEHWQAGRRSIHGASQPHFPTTHPARIVFSDGVVPGAASGERSINKAATVWLLDHPRPVVVGDTFGLPDSVTMTVVRVERRYSNGGTLTKAYLS